MCFLVFGFVCAEGALRLASQERATAVTQWLSLTEITTDLSALSEKEVLSVGEITPTQISSVSPISVAHYCSYLGGEQCFYLPTKHRPSAVLFCLLETTHKHTMHGSEGSISPLMRSIRLFVF